MNAPPMAQRRHLRGREPAHATIRKKTNSHFSSLGAEVEDEPTGCAQEDTGCGDEVKRRGGGRWGGAAGSRNTMKGRAMKRASVGGRRRRGGRGRRRKRKREGKKRAPGLYVCAFRLRTCRCQDHCERANSLKSLFLSPPPPPLPCSIRAHPPPTSPGRCPLPRRRRPSSSWSPRFLSPSFPSLDRLRRAVRPSARGGPNGFPRPPERR